MSLKTFPADTGNEKIIETLQKEGACILEDALSQEDIDQVFSEMGPYIEEGCAGNDSFTGFNTKRIGALVARSKKCRNITTHPKIIELSNKFLRPYSDKIQLHLSQIIAIMPGQEAQTLHRDRLAWGGYLPKSIEPQINTIWALTDFSEENGATHVVPESQQWPLDKHAKPEESIQAVMKKGSVLLYTGTVIHGGGQNRSNFTRIGMNITYCLGWLRTEENMMLSCPPEIAKSFSPELTDLLGYTMGSYALGYYSSPEQLKGIPDTLPPENALGRKVEKWYVVKDSQSEERISLTEHLGIEK